MHEHIVHLSATEDLAQLQMEKSSLQYHRATFSHRTRETDPCSKSKRRVLILLEETSTFPQLLFAWLTTFGILITTRNFIPTGLKESASQFPLCDPTDWRDTSPYNSRLPLHDQSCEYQIVQLVALEVFFWINIIVLLWHTRFGQRNVVWVFAATTASTGLAMFLVNDLASALLLAMPVILSTIASIGYVLDTTR
ncbi:hypothetical protein LZ30DRAFT_723859 [Colletotrichum cereale]|nr:hypothetical protein LZ30DRAFT_723859 [Colletotrichum cereale]